MIIKESLFAARISPIARFSGEAPQEFVSKYKGLFNKYFDLEVLTGILEGKDKYVEVHNLMVRAGELALSETDRAGGAPVDGRRKNLASVFSRLSISDTEKDRSSFYRYRMAELTPQNAFPLSKLEQQNECPLDERTSEDELRTQRNKFYKEMDTFAENPPRDYDAFSICFDRISKRYMWCYSASDYEGEDISLYDNMKVTEAIMACLLKCTDQSREFTMVIGDFSGIQKYIFAIASANFDNVAKRLRARSFYVDTISKVFSQYVVDSFGVGRANILLQTGGKFYCIVPTVDNIDEKLEYVRNEFDDYLYRKFHGSVSVNLAWLVCGDLDLEQYSDTIVRLNDLLGEKKSRPFDALLKNQKGWNLNSFILCDSLADKHLCKNCGLELIDSSKDSCSMCDSQIKIGEKLPKTKYIVYVKGEVEGKDTYPVFNHYSFRLVDKISEESFQNAYLIEALNDAAIDEQHCNLPIIRKYMANHIPMEGSKVKNFSQIADASTGMSKLAVLKADVDVLGFLFAQGLRTKERHLGTISRVNTMSRMLEIFFSGYIQELLQGNPQRDQKYRDVYSVFSGGDDMFLIGPWDVMMDLAVCIQRKFKKFVADNKDVTMSAAVSIFGGREHIAFMADYSEDQLDRAKNDRIPKIYPERNGRNAVCVMGQLFAWEDFDEQLEAARKLESLLKFKQLDVSILRRLQKYSIMYKQFLIGDIWKLMFEPWFYYDRKRNYCNSDRDKERKWFYYEYIKSMENAADDRNIRKNLYFAETTVKIALNKTRKERS